MRQQIHTYVSPLRPTDGEIISGAWTQLVLRFLYLKNIFFNNYKNKINNFIFSNIVDYTEKNIIHNIRHWIVAKLMDKIIISIDN